MPGMRATPDLTPVSRAEALWSRFKNVERFDTPENFSGCSTRLYETAALFRAAKIIGKFGQDHA